jgi:hypothetical protein
MKANYKLALTLLAGIGLGGAIIEGVHAQMKAPTYVVVAIRKITDAEGYKEVMANPHRQDHQSRWHSACALRPHQVR